MAKQLFLCGLAFLAALTIVGVDAHVGTAHMLGTNTRISNDDYIMCDKCTWDEGASSSTGAGAIGDGTAFYKLTCDSAATNSSDWATLHYGCSIGCVTCAFSSKVKIGSTLPRYTTASLVIPRVAASINCCPEIVERTYWNDDVCSTAGKYTYFPAGCSWSEAFDNYEQLICDDDGDAPDKWKSGCTASPHLTNGVDCPADPSGCASVSLSNLPCVRFNHQSNPAFSKQTFRCRKNGNQMCLRAVRDQDYVASMTPGVENDLASLTCSDLYNGASDYRQGFTALVAVVMAAMVMVF